MATYIIKTAQGTGIGSFEAASYMINGEWLTTIDAQGHAVGSKKLSEHAVLIERQDGGTPTFT